MPTYIEMPKLSDTMTEGTLLKWRKKKGDKVEAGDILAEVETDKATMEMESFDDGILTEVFVNEGEKVAVGKRLALLLAPSEKPPADGGMVAESKQAGTAQKREAAAAPAGASSSGKESGGKQISREDSTGGVAQEPAVTSGNGRVKASPLAKKLAREKGIDLSRISGSGPGGRVVQNDVLSAEKSGGALSQKAPQPASQAAPTTVLAMPAGERDQRIALTGMRKTIADRLLASKTQIPHFYLNIEVNAAEIMRIRADINAVAEKAGQPKLTINDFVLKAAVVAATKVPKVNAAWAGDAVIQYASVHLAVAVAIEDGLITPVVRDAQSKGLREISAAVKDLATRARGKKLKPEEYQGGTMTVSNLGAYGIDNFSGIINPPQSFILSVGAIVKKPVVNAKNEIVAGQRMSVSMSCDHRVIDGAIGAEYLAELRRLLENPTLMLI